MAHRSFRVIIIVVKGLLGSHTPASSATIGVVSPLPALRRVTALGLILVCPNWKTEAWWQAVQKHIFAWHYIPDGTELFEVDGQSTGPTCWGMWAYWVNGPAATLHTSQSVNVSPVRADETPSASADTQAATS